MLTEKELGYAGGIIDGEGCIGIYARKTSSKWNEKYPPLRVSISVSQTDRRLTDWLKEKFGGYVNSFQNKNKNSKLAHTWCIVGKKQCVPFIEKILPYLMIKKDQALIAGALMSEEINMRHLNAHQKRDRYWRKNLFVKQIKELNYRGIRPATTKCLGRESVCDSLLSCENKHENQ